jgi:hypothetical protein
MGRIMHICSYCQTEFKNAGGLGSHEPYCTLNQNRIQRKKSPLAHRPKGMVAWNKGIACREEQKKKFPCL